MVCLCGWIFLFINFFLLRWDTGYDTQMVADRFMYLPSLGFCLLMGKFVELLWQGGRRKVFLLILIGALTFLLAFRSHQYTKKWEDTLTLFRHELKYYPTQYIALTNTATTLSDQKDYQQAIRDARNIFSEMKQIGAEPVELSSEQRSSLEKVYYLRHLYRTAIKRNPRAFEARYNLGNLYRDTGKIRNAMDQYHQIIKLNPLYEDAYFALGELYCLQQQVEEALNIYQQALATFSGDPVIFVKTSIALNNQRAHLSPAARQKFKPCKKKY